ncbi:alpha/beta hydrolase [Streptomyces misionensis]|uniref:alpha/beta hydrolase n=1 Tax=Streptomyces misionensis TaxID=67331 RepID=UPI00368D18EF
MAASLPKADLSDLAAAREAEQMVSAHLPVHESSVPLSVQDMTIPGPPGAPDVRARVYAPAERSRPLPGLLYLHGGGFVMGGLALIDSPARMLAERAGVVVVAVDYRLAPEHAYPAALEDSYAALVWAGDRGGDHGIDTERLGVLGESAGGGLAAALTMLTRERGGPRLIAQFLDAPTVDDRLNTPSMRNLPDTPVWQSVNSPISWSHYLHGTATPGAPDVPVHAAPARAKTADLEGLPPALVVAYQVDPTRDEGLDYARLLIEAGVPTDIRHYGKAFHAAHFIPGTVVGTRMINDRIEAVRAMLAG